VTRTLWASIGLTFALTLTACGPAETSATTPTTETNATDPGTPPVSAGPDRSALANQAESVLGILPKQADSESNPISEAKVVLGRTLFYDARLSKNHDVSCNSCHGLDNFGVDSQPNSAGHKGQRGGRNSPTVYNAAFHVAQFWDGRAADVEAQAKGPVLNPIEMAMPDEASVVAVLKSIPGYAPLFGAAFPGEADPITYDNMARAIGAFERRLTTPGRFDLFLTGKLDALSDPEVAGLSAFMNAGCITCHMGPAVGGGLYRKLGLIVPYPTEDPGREAVTGNPNERHVFKVPSLRNVAKTGPWFHDGSITDLAEVVRIMGKHQLGQDLSEQQVGEIVIFLESLTGSVDAAYIAVPELPESGPDTPAPDPS